MRRWLPLWTGLIPIIAIHLTYLVAAAEGHVPWCFPYIDSCTSISATGRHGTAFYLFKAIMIPYAAVLGLFWLRTRELLLRLGDTRRAANTVMGIGIVAAVFLVVYTVALGAGGDFFYLQRRIGIILYFSMTALGEMLFTWRLGKQRGIEDKTRPLHLGIVYAFLGIGILTVFLNALMDNYVDYEDAFEWGLALLMKCYFLVMYFTWRQPGFVSSRP